MVIDLNMCLECGRPYEQSTCLVRLIKYFKCLRRRNKDAIKISAEDLMKFKMNQSIENKHWQNHISNKEERNGDIENKKKQKNNINRWRRLSSSCIDINFIHCDDKLFVDEMISQTSVKNVMKHKDAKQQESVSNNSVDNNDKKEPPSSSINHTNFPINRIKYNVNDIKDDFTINGNRILANIPS